MRSQSAPGDSVAAGSSLALISVGGAIAIRPLDQIKCELSRLSFSPDSRLAVAQGDTNAPPALIDLHAQTCSALTIREPIRVLSWAPDASAFLYFGQNGGPATFHYDLASGHSALVAISSRAAAYASDGTIVALGNDALSWRRVADASSKPFELQIALIPSNRGITYANPLGFRTSPLMLAQSSMVFSEATDDAAMDIKIPDNSGTLRELIDYSYPARAAFLLASGPADAALALSWSPDGRLLALVDTAAQPNRLTVLAPPR
jgi:hypothetical protein